MDKIDQYLDLLQDGTFKERVKAAKMLYQFNDERCIQPLISALDDPMWHVRVWALRALLQFPEVNLMHKFPTLIKDESKKVRRLVIDALAFIETQESTNLLRGQLKVEINNANQKHILDAIKYRVTLTAEEEAIADFHDRRIKGDKSAGIKWGATVPIAIFGILFAVILALVGVVIILVNVAYPMPINFKMMGFGIGAIPLAIAIALIIFVVFVIKTNTFQKKKIWGPDA